MIQHSMIIVEPDTNMDQARRKTCEEVNEVLKNAYERCLNEEEYAIKKNPWGPNKLPGEPLMDLVKINMTNKAKEVITKNMSKLKVHRGAKEDQSPTIRPASDPIISTQ
jgi:hypothetical protein